MKKIIRQILKEDRKQMFLDKIVHVMKNDFPLFKNMELYGFYDQLSEDELIYVLSGIFGEKEPVRLDVNEIYDEYGNLIYYEHSDDHWEKWEHDERNNEIYYETSNGFWIKRKYDENGNEIYYEDSDGYWEKYEYDENGKQIYYEDSDGLIRDYR